MFIKNEIYFFGILLSIISQMNVFAADRKSDNLNILVNNDKIIKLDIEHFAMPAKYSLPLNDKDRTGIQIESINESNSAALVLNNLKYHYDFFHIYGHNGNEIISAWASHDNNFIVTVSSDGFIEIIETKKESKLGIDTAQNHIKTAYLDITNTIIKVVFNDHSAQALFMAPQEIFNTYDSKSYDHDLNKEDKQKLLDKKTYIKHVFDYVSNCEDSNLNDFLLYIKKHISTKNGKEISSKELIKFNIKSLRMFNSESNTYFNRLIKGLNISSLEMKKKQIKFGKCCVAGFNQ